MFQSCPVCNRDDRRRIFGRLVVHDVRRRKTFVAGGGSRDLGGERQILAARSRSASRSAAILSIRGFNPAVNAFALASELDLSVSDEEALRLFGSETWPPCGSFCAL